MTKDEIIKTLRDMAKYPTVTLPRDCEALRMAADLLAQPEQERTGNCPLEDCDGGPKTHGCWAHHCEWKAQPAQQEPVAYRSRMINRDGQAISGWVVHLETTEEPNPRYEVEPLYTSPPPRQPLTDEEMNEIYRKAFNMIDSRLVGNQIKFVRAIEAAHGIKGEA